MKVPEFLRRELMQYLSREEFERRLRIIEKMQELERVDDTACIIMALFRENMFLRENLDRLAYRVSRLEAQVEELVRIIKCAQKEGVES